VRRLRQRQHVGGAPDVHGAQVIQGRVQAQVRRRMHDVRDPTRQRGVRLGVQAQVRQGDIARERLDALVTSRFHAAVLSLAAGVPQVAFGHDVRLEALYQDLGIADRFFVRHPSPDAFDVLKERLGCLLADPEAVRPGLLRGHAEHLGRARRNRDLLRAFVQAHGWETAS